TRPAPAGTRRREDLPRASRGALGSVMEVDDAALEAAIVEQLEPHPHVVGKGARSPAHDDRVEEEMALVDEAGGERRRGEVGTSHGEVALGRRLPTPDRL